MIRHLSPFRALVEALDALGHAKKPTTALIHRACERFVEMVAEITGQRVTVWIGETPIARGDKAA
ncbi:hypothetical protein NOV72_03691 [Caballeronia novacaledonica]|uniref:Uncharacterized protein n=1 Tax=Caballeronia novacaledonica TaxID=1544861 RepID=A0A2U3I8H9_9BURK|nr:hypothetical protein [Caballeronia novacaledonica]SPB16491.1 hypothetical protein NOV72_03691 [Caballeronia novacaledonica]